MIFRWRIAKIYKMLNLIPPKELEVPISEANFNQSNFIESPKSSISPRISGSLSTFEDWREAGKINLNTGMSTMHKIGEIISEIYFGYDSDYVYFRIELMEFVEKNSEIKLIFINKNGEELIISHSNNCFSIDSNSSVKTLLANKDVIDVAIAMNFFDGQMKLSIETNSDENRITYPQNDCFIFSFL
jgi:hypothetical protein